MECYEGAKMIKTYRGMLSHNAQDHIRLKTNRGDIGYRVVKFQVIANVPGTTSHEAVTQIWKLKQAESAADPHPWSIIDFTDGDLLAASFASALVSGFTYTDVIVFDSKIFNQDIYITNNDVSGNTAKMNYYLELEQIMLNENESTMATLQSLRQIAER